MWKIVFCALIAQVMSFEESNCTCGRASDAIFSMRIVGGRRAVPHSHPWAVVILFKARINCGGVLVTKQHVLAAGHCFKWNSKTEINNMTILIGLDNLLDMNGVEVRNITDVFIHENFTSIELRDENDIAVVTMNAPVEFNDRITPICLPHANQDFTHRMSTIVGWGRIGVEEPTSNVLLQASIRVMSDKECKGSKLGEYVVSETMMCAYYRGRDGCQGDSGGPMLAFEPSGHYVLAGIVSWGIGCGDVRYPGVYTKISKFMDWISENVPGAETCE